MASCAQCSTFILFGGVTAGADRFCNEKCHQGYQLMQYAEQVPAQVVQNYLAQIHGGACPKCGGAGPIDIHRVHKIWSLLVLTSWSSTPYLYCRSCATKGQIGGAVFSLIAGWWGFPWGLCVTPLQIGRNIVGMAAGPRPDMPSEDLVKFVKVRLASEMLQSRQSPPPLPPRN